MKLCCLGERYSEIQKSDRGRQFCSSSMPKWSVIIIFTYFIIFKMVKNELNVCAYANAMFTDALAT